MSGYGLFPHSPLARSASYNSGGSSGSSRGYANTTVTDTDLKQEEKDEKIEEVEGKVDSTESSLYKSIENEASLSNFISFEIEVVEELRSALQQYFVFFSDFISKYKGVSITFEVIRSEIGVQILVDPKEEDVKEIGESFEEYLNYLRENYNASASDLSDFIVSPSKPDDNIINIELKNQVRFFQSSLEIANLRLKSLEQKNDFLNRLLDEEATFNPMNIAGNGIEIQNKVAESVSKNRTKEAINFLMIYSRNMSNDELNNKSILFKSSFEAIQRDYEKGCLTTEEKTVSITILHNRILLATRNI